MADGQFSPDLLLTVGADLTALRQQLATIQREIGATPLTVGLQPQQTQQAVGGLNEMSVAVRRVQGEVDTLRKKQEAMALSLKNDLRDLEQAYTRNRAVDRQQVEQNARLDQQMGRLRIQAEKEYRLAQSQGLNQVAAEEQRLRLVQRTTSAESVRQAREEMAIAVERQRQLRSLAADYERLAVLQGRAAAGITAPVQQRVGAAQVALGTELQALRTAGTVPLSPAALQTLKTEVAALSTELKALGVTTANTDGLIGGFFGKLGRYAQIAIGLTLVYSTMRAAAAGFREFVEVDQILSRVAATMERGANRAEVLRGAYSLMVEANRTLGTSFSESGKVIFELEKSLGNNTEAIRAAFLPALTLVSIGEGNQTEILRTLIGLYKVYGDTLGDTSPQEKYLRISDALIAASAASIQDIDGFRTALQNVAPAAKQSGASLEETLALLVQLTNGMQSASRAGTGLRQLFVDLQTNPQGISRTFGIPFDVDAPLSATRLLDQVIRKVRELGTDSLRSQAMLQAAFPDKRALLAFETLVELYPEYSRKLDEVTRASGRTAEAQKDLANQVSAAAGRLSGAVFNEFVQVIDKLSGVKPGQAAGLVGLLDLVSGAVRIAGEETRKYIDDVNALLALLDRLSGGAAGKAAETGATSQTIGAGLLGLVSPQAAARLLLPESPAAAQARAERLRAQQAQRAREIEAQQLGGANIELQPGDNSAFRREQIALSAELARRIAELRREVDLEAAVGNKDLDLKQRIAAADAVLVLRTKQRLAAESELRGALGVSSKDLTQVEQAGSRVKAALEAERRAAQETRNLRNEDTLLQIKVLKDQEDRLRERGHLTIQIQENISSRTKIALGDEVEAFKRAQEEELKAATQKFSKLTEDEQTLAGREEYRTRTLEALRKAQLAGATDAEDLTRALSGQVGVLTEIFNRIQQINSERGQGGPVGIAADGFQTLDSGIQAIIDKTLGLNKIADATREIAATMGLVGAEAARAAVAARLGFESFSEMLEVANRVRERERQGVAGPPTPREQAAVLGVRGGERAAVLTREQDLKLAEKQITDLERAEKALQVTFGQTTEEATRQSLAIRITGKTFDELAGSTEEADRKLAQLLASIGRLTAASRVQAAVNSLMAAGFDEVTATMIATQNAADRIELTNLRAAGEEIEEFNTRAERMQEAVSKIAQESARASGDPFAFFTISLKRASDAAGGFWDHLKTLAEDTAKSMSQSLSDFFFDSFQDKLDAGKDAWKSFLGSMERALADFMSKQLVRSFLNILTGGGGEASTGVAGVGGAGIAGALGGAASGFGSIGANYSAGGGGFAGIGAALFGLPMTPTTVRAGLPPSNPEIDDPTSFSQIQTVRQATSGLIGTGGQVSKDLQLAGVIAAAYTTSQSVLKLTNEISTQQDRNSATGGIAGTIIGGLAGAYFGQGAIGAGIGGIAGSYLGGLFGSDQAPAGRFDELARTIGTVQTSLEAAVTGAKTFTDLYNVLLGFQGGGALAAATQQPVSISAGGQAISGLSQEAFLTALRANPSSLIASVQAGVSPELLGPINQEVVQTILAKVAALDDVNRQISLVIAEISAQTIAPATGINSFETLREQAVNFRATVDQLIAANEAQVLSLEDLLRVTTDPGQILQYTTQIKDLIQDRYRTETQLVQQFAGQLDSLATSLTNVGKSIEEQIFNLQLSNFGPTNPLQGFQLAQGRFNTARAAFEANPTAENAQAVQQAVDPLLKAASEVFTRPSPEYRAIFAEVVDALETVKISVDSQAADIQGALQAALGTSITIQDLTQRNTAAMAADMRQLLAIVQAQAAAAGVGVGAGAGFLNPANNQPPGGQVTAPTSPAPTDGGGSQTGALLAAVGTIGALAGPLLTIADKLGATDYLKGLIASIFTTTNPAIDPATASNYFTGGGPDPGLVAPTLPTFTFPDFTFPDFLSGASYSPYSFYDYGAYYPSYYDYGYLAEGGPVPGSGMGDTVRAMLEPGEFVVRRDAVARNREWLEQINGPGSGVSRRGILHFQDGGMVPGTTSNTVASAEDIAILLYLQSLLGGSSADAQALLAELLRQAEASQNPSATPTTGSASTSPATPSTVSGGATTATPSVVEADADATAEMIRSIQTLLRGGQTVAGLFSSGDLAQVLGPAGSVLGIASGALGLFSGIASGDPFGAAAGGVQLAASTISLLASTGVISSIPYVGGYAQLALAAIQIAQIATNGDLSDEEKAIQATKAATTAVALALAGPTFGASLAVLQIWDFVERMRAGQPFDQAIVSANDPTTLLNALGSDRDLSISGMLFNPSQDWMNFVPELYENANTQGEGFEMLLKALPYVKSKEELGQLLNTQKNWVSSITGIPLSVFSGVDSPYSIQAIPGIGSETHGVETTPVDWAETSNAFQQLIDVYKALLPGSEITAQYGQSGGALTGEAVGRLWNQFRLDDPGWFSRATYAGAPMPFDVLNNDSQFVNTEHNESGANYVLNPYWVPYGMTQVYAGVNESGVNMFTPWGPGYVNELGIYFDPKTGGQVWVAPGGPFPPTIESMYQVSPEWRLMQALYGLPEVQPVTAPNVGPTLGYTPPQPTGNPVIDQNLPQIQAIAQDLGVSQEYAALILGQQISDFSSGGMREGGWVPGVSRGTDSVPTWLEPGEFVVPRAVAKANSELLMSLLGEGGGTWDGLYRSDFGSRVSSAARDLIGGSWDGLHRSEMGSTISAAAMSGDYRREGGVSSVALHIAEGAIRIDGARDPKVVSKDVLEAIEQNIRTGRLGQVIASRVRPQRTGV